MNNPPKVWYYYIIERKHKRKKIMYIEISLKQNKFMAVYNRGDAQVTIDWEPIGNVKEVMKQVRLEQKIGHMSNIGTGWYAGTMNMFPAELRDANFKADKKKVIL